MSVFTPAGTVSLAASGTTGSVKMPVMNSPRIRVYNSGSVPVFIKAGKSDVAAVVTDMPVAPGTVEVFDLKASVDQTEFSHIAGITGGTAATVYFTCGQGE